MLIAWNLLGLLDFVVAFGLWFLCRPDMTQMLVLPLSFIPMAGVPIATIVHIIALLRLLSASSVSER
jgi:hypothetical protein